MLFFLLTVCTGNNPDISHSKSAEKNNAVQIAEKFTLTETDSCTILTIIDPWQGASGIRHIYYLVGREQEKQLSVSPGNVIFVPVKNVICMSTTHLAMIAALNERQSVTGISGTEYVYDEGFIRLIEEGRIKDIGYESGLNNELILKISPELLVSYGVGSESIAYTGKINELGIKTLFNADYLEEDPLGKAEWIKLFGALYCKESIADSIFRSVAQSYNTIKDFVEKNIQERPMVMMGMPFRDTWYISPGNSYISRLINDAGGDYIWKETESSASMPYGLEDVFIRSKDAEYWLNVGTATGKDEILTVDKRLENFTCYTADNIYNNNNRVSAGGGNDYWESGALYPNLILKDIAMILHPGLFEDRKLFYYRKLE